MDDGLNKEVIEIYCGIGERPERGLHAIIMRIELEICAAVSPWRINEQNTSIATGLSICTPKLMRFERSYLKLANPIGYRTL